MPGQGDSQLPPPSLPSPPAEHELDELRKKLQDARSEFSKEDRKLRDLEVS